MAVAPAESGDIKKSHFIKQLDHPAIEAAIARAEATTSGEIRVLVLHEPATDPVPAAQVSLYRDAG